MGKFVDIYIVYQIVKRLATPFTSTPAFKLGIIDQEGNVLRPMKSLNSSERSAWTWLDVFLNNIKRLLVKLPGGRSRFFTYAAAYFLLREPIAKIKEAATWDLPKLEEAIWKSGPSLNEAVVLCEDVANSAGSGQVAGIGVGPNGEPGFMVKRVPDFAGCRVFEVNSTVFQKCKFGKKKFARYEQYVGNDPTGLEIKEYGKANLKRGIILMDKFTGAMLYLRRPKPQK